MRKASKYVRGQGQAERARRLRQAGHQVERIAGYVTLANGTRRTVWTPQRTR